MNEDFDVKLVENAKYLYAGCGIQAYSWIGDYQKTYERFLSNPDAFWDQIAGNLNGSDPGIGFVSGSIPMPDGSSTHN